MPEKAILTIGDQQLELDIIEGSEGELAIDITELRSKTGMITYDPAAETPGRAKAASPLSMERREFYVIAAFPSKNSQTVPVL